MQVFGCAHIFNFIFSYVFISSFIQNGPLRGTYAWDNAEFEMFDLVEEVGKNFYEVLGVAHDASSKDIKSAYRKLSVKIHPDKNPSPDASEKFRQLVGIYEVLKDDELRKSYNDVLVNGLPNWKQPIFYFRRARKFAVWQVTLILLIIVSVGQYLAGWASYFEKRLSMRETIEYRLRQRQRSRKAQKDGPTLSEIEAEMKNYLQTPSLWDLAPFQILRGLKYLVFNLPGDILAYWRYLKEKKEEEAREAARIQEEEEELRRLAEEPKKPRKRKTFVAPKKEEGDEPQSSVDNEADVNKEKKPAKPVYVSGGLWTDDDIGELAKLCSKFPGGTPDRWEKISDALRRPVPEVTFMAKKVMERLSKRTEEEEVQPQVKVKVKTKGKADAIATAGDNITNWTAEEQKCLEKALLVYPKGALERWEKIAQMVPGRTKDECLARFKYVAELVKKKKEKAEAPAEAETAESAVAAKEEGATVSSESENREESENSPVHESPTEGKDSVERKNSSSSNKSSSDGEWCMVEGAEASARH